MCDVHYDHGTHCYNGTIGMKHMEIHGGSSVPQRRGPIGSGKSLQYGMGMVRVQATDP